MPNVQQTILAKRLITLTRIVIVIFAVSLVSWLSKIDVDDLRKDLAAVDSLDNLRSQISEDELAGQGKIGTRAIDWLNQTNPKLANANFLTRIAVATYLDKIGIASSIQDLRTQNLVSYTQVRIDTPFTLQFPRNVGSLIDEYRFLCAPRDLAVATSAKPEDLTDITWWNTNYQLSGIRLAATTPTEGTINLLYKDYQGQPHFFFQEDVPEQSHPVQADVQTVNNVSLLALLGQEQSCLNRTTFDPVELDRVASIYGNLGVDIARNVITDGILREYKDVNLLGFTFSSRRYFEALLAVSLLVAIGILWTVRTARRAQLPIISSVENEDVTDIFVRSPVLRFTLWVLSVPVAILLALPPFAISRTESIVLIGGIVLLALLGLLSYWQSRRL